MKHKVLTVKQPWTYLICSGIKDIENRTWKLPEKYKGQRVLIHASANGICDFEVLSIEQFDKLVELSISNTNHFSKTLHTSAIIGSVEIVDCVINHPSIWAEKSHYEVNLALHPLRPIYNWVLANPVLFDKPIIGVRGKLGFWDYELPEEYYRMISSKE